MFFCLDMFVLVWLSRRRRRSYTFINTFNTPQQIYSCIEFVIFNPWKVPWNWIVFIKILLLYHLVWLDATPWLLANEIFTSNLRGLKAANCVNSFFIITANNTQGPQELYLNYLLWIIIRKKKRAIVKLNWIIVSSLLSTECWLVDHYNHWPSSWNCVSDMGLSITLCIQNSLGLPHFTQ